MHKSLECLTAKINRYDALRKKSTTVEEWCRYAVQVNRFRKIYSRVEKIGMTLEQIGDYNGEAGDFLW